MVSGQNLLSDLLKLLFIGLLFISPQELLGQASGRVPSEITQDLDFVNSSMDHHSRSFREYTRHLIQHNDNLSQIKEYMKEVRPNSPEYVVAAEAYESEFSEALRVQYDYVLGMIDLRRNTVATLNKMKKNYLRPTAVNRRYEEGVQKLNQQIQILEQQLVSLAVLDTYGELTTSTLQYINQKMSLLHYYDIPNTRQELDYLKTKGKQHLYNPSHFEAFSNQLSQIRAELLKLTSGAEAVRARIQTIASVLRDLAEDRLTHSELWITNHHLSELGTILRETGRDIIKIDRPDINLIEPSGNMNTRIINISRSNYKYRNINSRKVLQKYQHNL